MCIASESASCLHMRVGAISGRAAALLIGKILMAPAMSCGVNGTSRRGGSGIGLYSSSLNEDSKKLVSSLIDSSGLSGIPLLDLK